LVKKKTRYVRKIRNDGKATTCGRPRGSVFTFSIRIQPPTTQPVASEIAPRYFSKLYPGGFFGKGGGPRLPGFDAPSRPFSSKEGFPLPLGTKIKSKNDWRFPCSAAPRPEGPAPQPNSPEQTGDNQRRSLTWGWGLGGMAAWVSYEGNRTPGLGRNLRKQVGRPPRAVFFFVKLSGANTPRTGPLHPALRWTGGKNPNFPFPKLTNTKSS